MTAKLEIVKAKLGASDDLAQPWSWKQASRRTTEWGRAAVERELDDCLDAARKRQVGQLDVCND